MVNYADQLHAWVQSNKDRLLTRAFRKINGFCANPDLTAVRLMPDAIRSLGLVYGAEAILLCTKGISSGELSDWSNQAHLLRIEIHNWLCEREPNARRDRSFFWLECITEAAALICLLDDNEATLLRPLSEFFQSQDEADIERFGEKQFELWVLSVMEGKQHSLLEGEYADLFENMMSPTTDELSKLLQTLSAKRERQANASDEQYSIPFSFMLMEQELINRHRVRNGLQAIAVQSIFHSTARDFSLPTRSVNPEIDSIRTACIEIGMFS